MFAPPSSYGGMPPHGYGQPYPTYTTTPMSSPPIGGAPNAFWDYSHTPAPTPQPAPSPFPGSGRSSTRRRRSEQLSRDGIPPFPATPQPQRHSTTPAGFAPYYNTPSPRPYSHAPSPTPGPADFYYAPMGPGGPMPPVTPSFSPPHQAPTSAADYDYVPHSPMHQQRTRSRNSKSRTPGAGSDSRSPAPADDRKASPPTREQAAAAGIPHGYSTKNWDQQERPIMLLGSVFDANSLGKWIYDWTVYRHGTTSQTTELAGELWLLLIQLSGKSKRARECVENNRIKRQEKLVLVTEFLESGERLWDRMKRLLKHCEEYMWKGAQAANGADPDMRKGSPNVTMGKQSGKEFVDAMFGRERQMERTEKLMTGMRLWSTRFDANCEEILKRPHA